jgi:hypothetical protein
LTCPIAAVVISARIEAIKRLLLFLILGCWATPAVFGGAKISTDLLLRDPDAVVDVIVHACRPQKENSSLGGLLHQAIFMMQAAKHRRLHNTVTGGQFMSVAALRNAVLGGFRYSRAE